MCGSVKKHKWFGPVLPIMAMVNGIIGAAFVGVATKSLGAATAVFCGLIALFIMVIWATSEIVNAIEALKSSEAAAKMDEEQKQEQKKNA